MPERRFFVSADELRRMYYQEKLSISEIAKRFNVDKSVSLYWMMKYGIKRRSRSEATKIFYEIHPEEREENAKRLKKLGVKKRGQTPWWKKRGLSCPSETPAVRQKISIAHKALVGEKHPHWKPRVVVLCSQCGKEFMVEQWYNKQFKHKFCSSKCRGEWRSQHIVGENHPHWEGGSTHYYGPNWLRQKRKALERDNHTCRICSAPENGRKYHVHHIIPFAGFGLERYEKANRLENLITLCPSCHAKMDFLGGNHYEKGRK